MVALLDLINMVFRRVDQPRLLSLSDFNRDEDTERVVDSLNRALRNLYTTIPYGAMPRIITSFSASVGVANYTLGDNANPKKIISIRNTETGNALTQADIMEVISLGAAAVGQWGPPAKFYERSGQIALHPVPDKTYTYVVEAAKQYIPFSQSVGTSDIPDEWQDYLVQYAIWVEKAELNVPDAVAAKNEYEYLLNKLLGEASLEAYGLTTSPPNGLD
jgi:hypothetical protein